MSFYTSLSGLKGAQTDLAVISNNVANVGTIGFKKSNTQFADIISSAGGATAGQGTRLVSIGQQFTQGGFKNSDRQLDLAISGQGFFVTRNGVTNGSLGYTRNGSFTVNKDRYVVDGTGGYLQVLPTAPDGTVSATGLASTRNLQLPLTSGDSKATTTIAQTLTLPVGADLPADRAVYATKPYVFDRLDPNSYNQSTARTVYDSDGNEFQATTYYVRKTAPTATDPTSSWEAHMFVGDVEVSSDPANTSPPVPLTLNFDSNGVIASPTAPTSYAPVLPSGAVSPLSLTVDYGVATKQASSPFNLAAFTQDGYAAGQLDNISIGGNGLVTATFSNGATQALGKIVMASFSNPEGLRQLGAAKWGATGESGEPIVGEANEKGFGLIQSGALEQANVDITEELVALISAQRNFSANAKAIETANTMTQTIVNLRT
jgi:flagellar hook protein FlgE